MEFRLLGPLAVIDDHGIEVPLKGARLRSLLAVLVLHANEVVPVDTLVEALWGDDQPVDAGGSLHSQVSRLRAALRRGDGGGDAVETRPPGYILVADVDDVDSLRFEARVEEARALLRSGNAAAAADTLGAALALWRGEAVADFAGTDVGVAERARLNELRRVAVEDKVEADLACGRHVEVVGDLEALVAAEPLRERRTAQLMVALYRSGRQADALRAYQATREVLAEELGIDPGPELRSLEAAVLAQDPQLEAPAQVAVAPPAPRTSHRVPVPLTECIGRASHRQAVEAMLDTGRLVTLVGPGGVGKTRLGLEVALSVTDRHAGGAALVELATVEDPRHVIPTFARAIGLGDAVVPSGDASGDDLRFLSNALTDTDLVLLVDNCEHLLDEVDRVVVHLLGRCPGLRVLATSQQALGIAGEATYLVPPLEIEDAAALFAERAATQVGAEAFAGHEQEAVADICRRLDGMPLAIELAASRTRIFSVQELARRLDDRFAVVAGSGRGALPRHRTLRAVVEWSVDLLDAPERRVFERLSTFVGGFTIESAEAVVAGDDVAPEDVADIVERLVDRSLVTAIRTADGVRFRLLQTLVDFGRAQVSARGETDELRRRLARWILDCAIEHETTRGWMSFSWDYAAEADNVRSVVSWAAEHDPALALELGGWLGWYWSMNDLRADGWRVLSAGLADPPDVPPDVLVRAGMWAAHLAAGAGHPAEGPAYAGAAVALARTTGDAVLAGRATVLHAGVLSFAGVLDEASALAEDARRLLTAGGDERWLASLDLLESYCASFLGDHERALATARKSVEAAQRFGDKGAVPFTLERLGEAAEDLGNLDEASAALEEVRRLRARSGVGRRSFAAARLARVRAAQGRLDEALDLAEEAVTLAQMQGWGAISATASHARGLVLHRLGRSAEALAELDAAIAGLASSGWEASLTPIRALRAEVAITVE